MLISSTTHANHLNTTGDRRSAFSATSASTCRKPSMMGGGRDEREKRKARRRAGSGYIQHDTHLRVIALD